MSKYEMFGTLHTICHFNMIILRHSPRIISLTCHFILVSYFRPPPRPKIFGRGFWRQNLVRRKIMGEKMPQNPEAPGLRDVCVIATPLCFSKKCGARGSKNIEFLEKSKIWEPCDISDFRILNLTWNWWVDLTVKTLYVINQNVEDGTTKWVDWHDKWWSFCHYHGRGGRFYHLKVHIFIDIVI